ncbi:MAG: hypothetical protein GXN99_02100 [Candidatus Nanohaloarchaeota archaeon]|nr:hypothetical protein [Candidatus Nanohaloarchaeota archaeon]
MRITSQSITIPENLKEYVQIVGKIKYEEGELYALEGKTFTNEKYKGVLLIQKQQSPPDEIYRCVLHLLFPKEIYFSEEEILTSYKKHQNDKIIKNMNIGSMMFLINPPKDGYDKQLLALDVQIVNSSKEDLSHYLFNVWLIRSIYLYL